MNVKLNRNKVILLNKANKALKYLSLHFTYANLTINNYEIRILLLGVTSFDHNQLEPLIKHFIKENVNWKMIFENSYIVFKIWI